MDGGGDMMAIIGGVGVLMIPFGLVMSAIEKDKGFLMFSLVGLLMAVAGAVGDNHVAGGYGF